MKINITPLRLALMFHNYYELLAPLYGYETKKETKVFEPMSNNGRLMVATCEKILEELNILIE